VGDHSALGSLKSSMQNFYQQELQEKEIKTNDAAYKS
jgi:hypothetical protein